MLRTICWQYLTVISYHMSDMCTLAGAAFLERLLSIDAARAADRKTCVIYNKCLRSAYLVSLSSPTNPPHAKMATAPATRASIKAGPTAVAAESSKFNPCSAAPPGTVAA